MVGILQPPAFCLLGSGLLCPESGLGGDLSLGRPLWDPCPGIPPTRFTSPASHVSRCPARPRARFVFPTGHAPCRLPLAVAASPLHHRARLPPQDGGVREERTFRGPPLQGGAEAGARP